MHRADNFDYPDRDNPAACEPVEVHDEVKCKVPIMDLTELVVACFHSLCMHGSKPYRETISVDDENVERFCYFHDEIVSRVVVGTILFSCTTQRGSITPHLVLNNGFAVARPCRITPFMHFNYYENKKRSISSATGRFLVVDRMHFF